mmetsp:Transcript_23189/g.38379  ORF Transcript_23189/g.38379 Transcript_23189/m.38379 type:complete len:323 (-) Transcript_23189:59-1027(-)|eukprot:CAMPEP_0119013618 /NCGR_PEP_ID=MMETSP1176-20130426/8606_1 /TAXON_ID=265551 /ORGANISM="Synedropsis recta cf, Strain CCMP1620" /LENGTH=322 /DNA_ID=CAMNT_0006966721 /DNA_START=114 /DNA_END=1082 /DNA_ORIENTATION=+
MSSRRYKYSGYEEDNEGVVQILASYTKNPIVLGSMALVAFLAVTADMSIFFDMIYGEKDARYNGRLPNSLLTLNYPYTLLRGVVAEQPVEDSDIPLFWHANKPDAALVQKVLNNCYSIETIELDSAEAIQKAKEVNLASRKGKKFAITSPFLREVAEIFTPENLGRATCFFRHPLDYELFDGMPSFQNQDNYMARLLLNDGVSNLGFKELGDAKQIIRDVCVTATMDKLVASFKRAADYYGWTLEGSEKCVEECVNEASMQERELDHDSDEWKEFYKTNRYDCQLYEFAQQAWRAQIQTIIPLSLQNQRVKRYEGDEEEEEN